VLVVSAGGAVRNSYVVRVFRQPRMRGWRY
jgi:hypothetical protein